MDQYPSQTAITNNEILTALAGILFFGPFITPFHKENHGEGQSSFVYPYLNVGKLNLILFAITVFFFIINYFAQTTVLQRLAS
ncbi:MAG: hypothetical protein LBU27_00725 [Candidatus Peribacteria bacterium]|jgi:hypothetical protein|nr:hypothetical protein [Candidatus Peribacteria bacterium]